jgi:type IV pilus assembly protein PilM
LPFDVDRARVSYHVQPQAGETISVIAAVILNSVLAEYESVLREAGYAPGVVIPSMLAALGQVEATLPTLVIKVERFTTSLAIVDQDRLVLLRTLENPSGAPPQAMQLAEDAFPSLVFYQDTFGTKVQKVLVNGVSPLEQFSAAMEEQTGLGAQELVSVSRLGGASSAQRSSLGGVVGVLGS